LALIRREKSNIVACPLELDGPKHELRRSSNSAPSSALTWGVINPIILLPRDSLTWHAKQMEMILIHEFAHLRRKDFASQLVSELVCAIYWFNPLVWLSARAMRDDAELAADEAVIRAGHRPSDYATELLHVAAKLSMNHQTLNRVGISNMKHPKIESRLQAVLSSTGTNRGITMVSILAALAVSGIAVTGIASLKLRQSDSKQDQQALALKRLKDLAFSTLVYAADYDEVLPSGKSTAQVEEVMLPYVRSKDMYKSPRKGAELKFNLKVAGMALKAIKKPATIQLWYESAPAGMDPIASFVDGHAKVLMSKNVPPQGENLNNLNPPILVQDKSGNWVVSGGK
jgi:type II secretory pathway pseudopilin PulG